MKLFAVVGKVHEVNGAIWREHDKTPQVVHIFISLSGCTEG